MQNPALLTHEGLTRVLFGSSAFQMLNAGCKLGLFHALHRGSGLSESEVGRALKLETRPTQILLLGTTALALTVRDGDRYRNGELVESMIASGTWEIIEDVVAFEEQIVIPAEVDFIESLRQNTNVGLRRFPGEGDDFYHRIASQPSLEQIFYRCMRSWSRLSNPILVEKAPLAGVRRVLDVGGGDAVNALELARANPETSFTVLDLPGAVRIARQKVAENGLSDRITCQEGDIFTDAYPEGHDCVLFANQLVIWSPEENLLLLRKAYASLPPGGRVLVFNAISDDSRDGPLYAALDNVYFATLPAKGSMLYRWGQYEEWFEQVGFSVVRRFPGGTWTPHGVLEARK
jgi:SAM-dependent methyltransferase